MLCQVSRFSVRSLQHPIVQAPMGGGPSTPALAAAVAEAGGLGFLAAGYKTADAVREDIEAVRALTRRPFGVNLFAPPQPVAEPDAVARFAGALGREAERYGAPLGEPRHDDDDWAAKLALVAELAVPVVSFTFGCPPRGDVRALQHAGAAVWVTVTRPEEAVEAAEEGADALVVQGTEAGGHRATFDDTAPGDIGLLALLQLVAAVVDLPLIATGGIMTGRGVAAVLAAGADAAALGTAFMLCPEAATAPAHRDALTAPGDTALTRAFTGRTARGIVNRWLREHDDAPSAYPDVHHLTAKVRAAARSAGDPDGFHLWAGQAHTLAEPVPAGRLVARLAAEARAALRAATGHP
jgi:nitronate monooxygenase